jgi:hypothetical protein
MTSIAAVRDDARHGSFLDIGWQQPGNDTAPVADDAELATSTSLVQVVRETASKLSDRHIT